MRRGALLALPLVLAGCAVGGREAALEVYGDAPAFALSDQLGRPVTEDALRGRVALADFIYTTCRESCPVLTQRMAALQDHLRAERLLGTKVVLLSFTVDPAHDTVPVLRDYAERHRADPEAWRFLTGPEKYLVPLIVQGFKLGVQRVPGEVMHSNRVVLVDRQGRIRAYYDGLEMDDARVLRDVRQLLR